MAQKTIVTYECDRCGYEDPDVKQFYRFTMSEMTKKTKHLRILDLCLRCSAEVTDKKVPATSTQDKLL